MKRKVRYVVEKIKSEPTHRHHTCHWPGCPTQVHPAQWGCSTHWYKLPKILRDKIWTSYRPGQEINLTPSTSYLNVADEVQAWIKAEKAKRSKPPTSTV